MRSIRQHSAELPMRRAWRPGQHSSKMACPCRRSPWISSLSPEAEARVVDATYEQLLGRAPDAAGLNNWVAALEQGLSPAPNGRSDRCLARVHQLEGRTGL